MTQIARPPCDDAVVRSAPACTPCGKRRGAWVLAATIIGSSLAFIDGTVVNLALPALQTDLGAGLGELQWIVEAYLLLLSALMLVGGMLGDRYGRRRVFGAGIGIFAAASIWCGLAPDAANLILARAGQGIGGALLVPGSLAILSATFAESQRGRAIGTWSGFTALATALGPVIGGWLVDAWSWRWIFFINIPPAALVLWILLRHVPESRDESGPSSLDWPGAFLATLGLGAIVFGLIEVGTVGVGNPVVMGSLAAGLVGLCARLLSALSTTPFWRGFESPCSWPLASPVPRLLFRS